MSITNCFGTALKLIDGQTAVGVGRLTSLGEIAPEVSAIDVTCLDGAWKSYIPGARDAGEIELKGYYDTDDEGQAALRAALSTGGLLTLRAEFPDGSSAGFTGFVKKYSVGAAEVDNALTFSVTLRLSGAVTFAEPEDDDDDDD